MAGFSEKLREEILQSQSRRSALIRQKLTYVIATFGLGSVSGDKLPAYSLLFLSPVIALAFDLYIAGEDFGIKRAGGFLGREGSEASDEEREWERRVREYWDPFSKFANVFVSFVVLASAAVILWTEHHFGPLYPTWIALNAVFIVCLWGMSHVKNKRVREFEKPMKEELANSRDIENS